ncbi:hypothetical protein RYX36_021468 [Vicia faba]
MGGYPARFKEHFLSVLVNGSPSIKQERSGYSHGGVTIDSIYYYGILVYQDVNLRSYFGSIRPPARLTFGFRLDPERRRAGGGHLGMSGRSGVFIPTTRKKKNKMKKNQMHFDPVVVLNHFMAPGVAEPSTMGGSNAQGRSLDKRIRSRIAFFVESSTSEKKCLAEAKKSKYRKGRFSKGGKLDGKKLAFGIYGTQSCRAGRLSYRDIDAACQAIIGHCHRAMSGQFQENGQVLFEMDGVSLSNARQAATLAAHKPRSSTKFLQWSYRNWRTNPICYYFFRVLFPVIVLDILLYDHKVVRCLGRSSLITFGHDREARRSMDIAD